MQVARRGSIIDVFPSTGDHPVRIDLWGDEVDRLTAFESAHPRLTGIANDLLMQLAAIGI